MSNSKAKPKASGPDEPASSESNSGKAGETIPHAYALVPVPGKLGKYRAVHLEGVLAEEMTDLEPNGRGEPAQHGLMRVESAMGERTRRKAWVK